VNILVEAAEGSRSKPDSRQPARVYIAVIVAVFVISRLVYRACGNRFASNLHLWQVLDPQLLRTDLWRSLYYLHDQPPLINAFLGLSLKLFPNNYPLFLQLVFWVLGIVLAVALFILLTEMEVPLPISLALALVFELSPATLGFESWYHNTYPSAVILCLAAVFLLYHLRTRRFAYGLAFVIAAGMLVLINSSFQIIWFAAMIAMLWALCPTVRSPALFKASVWVILGLLLLYVKNLLVFGTFTTSSWLGMNLAYTSLSHIPPAERSELVSAKVLNPVSNVRAFSPLSDYPGVPLRSNGIAALDQTTRSDGWPNFNNFAYIEIAHLYLKDDLWAIAHRPRAYLKGVAISVVNYLTPANEFYDFKQFNVNIPSWVEIYYWAGNPITPFRGLLKRYENQDHLDQKRYDGPSVTLAILLPVLIVFGVIKVVSAVRSGRSGDPVTVCLLFILIAIAYVSAAGTLIDCNENNRFRFVIDPLYVVLAGLFFTYLDKQLRIAAMSFQGKTVLSPDNNC